MTPEDKIKFSLQNIKKSKHPSLYILAAFYTYEYIRDMKVQPFYAVKEFKTFEEALAYKHTLEYKKGIPIDKRIKHYWIYPFP